MKPYKQMLIYKMLMTLCLVGILSAYGPLTFAAEVEAEGRAAGDQKGAREQALADALREAVRVGTGVDILSSSGVKDFALDYDRILSSAFGHVKTYQVLSSGLGKDQIYRVKVKADVEKGAPGVNNVLALKQIMLLKGAPRVSIKIEEQVDGVTGPTLYAQGIMEVVARELQFNLIDVGSLSTQEVKAAARDEIVGSDRTAKLRRADVPQKCDFQIQGKVVAKYVGQQSFYGGLPQHVYAIGGEMRAIRPDTGEIVATCALPGTENVESDLESKEMAARDVIQKVLSKGGKAGELPPLFNKIVARWITETDLGAIKRIEFAEVSNEEFQKSAAFLGENDKISAVWVREFDSKGISVIDVETRLDGGALGQVISKGSGDKLLLDHFTGNLVSCRLASVTPPPSSFMISTNAPAGYNPANEHRSTTASV